MSANLVIQTRYGANMGLIYGRLRYTGVVLVIMLAMVFAVVAESPARRYVGSVNSDKFHVPTCEWAQKINPQNEVYFASYDEAIQAGREPCKKCRPDKERDQVEPAKVVESTKEGGGTGQEVVKQEPEKTRLSEGTGLNPGFIVFAVVAVCLFIVVCLCTRSRQTRIMSGAFLVIVTVILFLILHSPEDVGLRVRTPYKPPAYEYTASRSGEVFHLSSCDLVKGISAREFFATFDGAIDSGKFACGECLSSGGHDTTRIAFWNIRKFSNRSRTDEELERICQVLEKYDMIAIAEVLDVVILRRAVSMLKTMGRDYRYEVSPKVGRGSKEQYAFLYDVSLFEVVKPGQVWPDPSDHFIREPYYASFRAGNFDFTMVVIHVIYGGGGIGPGDEIPELARVYTSIQGEDRNEQDVIFVGDFNMAPNRASFDNLRAIQSMACLFRTPARTNIANTKLYDNVWLQARHVSEYAGEKGIDKFDEVDFDNDDSAASLAVSDHRPVWAAFYVDKEDDDGEVRIEGQFDRKQVSLNYQEPAPSMVRGMGEGTAAEDVAVTGGKVYVYITSSGKGKKYHKMAECYHIRHGNTRLSLAEARRRRLDPCKTCKPE